MNAKHKAMYHNVGDNKMEMTIGQGRGSNQNSKKNIDKANERRFWIMDVENNHPLFGPYCRRIAHLKMEKLNKYNHTGKHLYYVLIVN